MVHDEILELLRERLEVSGGFDTHYSPGDPKIRALGERRKRAVAYLFIMSG
jgi:hypothetical protein